LSTQTALLVAAFTARAQHDQVNLKASMQVVRVKGRTAFLKGKCLGQDLHANGVANALVRIFMQMV
jgi:hypothetical protein